MLKRTLPIVLVLALAVLGFKAFPASSPMTTWLATPSPAAESTPAETAPADTIPLSDQSLYQLGSTWTNQHGESVPFHALRGKPQLVAMVFTRCGYACPRIVHDMKHILSALPEEQRDEVGATLVSIDPDRDTPEELHHFAAMHELSSPQWTLLRSDDSDVRELAAVLGVRYKQEADGQFAHSNIITLLNAEGEIVLQQEGLGDDPSGTIETLRTLVDG